jgi:hypothetical protein
MTLYGKHFASMYTGSMCGAGSHVYAVWGYVIAHAVDGQVELNPRLVAFQLGESQEQVEQAIRYLCSPDPQSRNKDDEGRRLVRDGEISYRVVSHATYRAITSTADLREYNRKKQRESRARRASAKQSVASVKQSVNDRHRSPASASGSSSDQDPDPPNRLGADPPGEDPANLPLRDRATRYLNDPLVFRMQAGPAEEWPEVREVLRVWGEVWRPFAVRGGMNDRSLRAILERFAEGAPPEELCDAIRGSRHDDFIMGKKSLQTPATVLADGTAIHKYSSLRNGNEPEKELTGLTKQRAEALSGAHGQRAMELAKVHESPVLWWHAVEEERKQAARRREGGRR